VSAPKRAAIRQAAAATSHIQEWAELGLALNFHGTPHANHHNAILIFSNHPRWKDHVWWDTSRRVIRTDYDGHAARDWLDSDDVYAAAWCQGPLKISKMPISAVRDAISTLAHWSERNERAEWVRGLQWDGVDRLDYIAHEAFGADDTPYARAVGATMMKAHVQRIRQPGSKVDHMVVLEGAQGIGKSRALEIIGGEGYTQLHSAFGTKDAIEEIQGKSLVEVAELVSYSAREAEATKAFLSTRVDRYRPPYGRHAVDAPRQCIFVGTTNENSYLRDPTGARRFFPLRCTHVNIDWLESNREQLFAEAMRRLSGGETWWDVPSAELEQEHRYEGDPWTDPIQGYLAERCVTTMSRVLTDGLHLSLRDQDKRAQIRAGAVIERSGWQKQRVGSRRTRVWVRPDVAQCGPSVVFEKCVEAQLFDPPRPFRPMKQPEKAE
jgi:predicted P-loop ATPase